MNMVTVATFNEPSKAEPLQQRLEKAGIHAEICDESRYEWSWFVTKPIAAIRLKVHKQDFENGRRLIREWDSTDGVLREAVRCPQCGSSRVEYPQFTRKFLLPNIVSLASVMGIIDKEFFCQECEYTWPKDAKPPWPRKHGAPNYFIEDVPAARGSTGASPSDAHGRAG